MAKPEACSRQPGCVLFGLRRNLLRRIMSNMRDLPVYNADSCGREERPPMMRDDRPPMRDDRGPPMDRRPPRDLGPPPRDRDMPMSDRKRDREPYPERPRDRDRDGRRERDRDDHRSAVPSLITGLPFFLCLVQAEHGQHRFDSIGSSACRTALVKHQEQAKYIAVDHLDLLFSGDPFLHPRGLGAAGMDPHQV